MVRLLLGLTGPMLLGVAMFLAVTLGFDEKATVPQSLALLACCLFGYAIGYVDSKLTRYLRNV